MTPSRPTEEQSMTDISKEAVERDCKSLRALSHHILVCFRADRVDAENVARVADHLEALSARVQELEAQNKTPKADYVRGRVQGIRDAVEVIDNAEVQDAYDEGCRIHFDDLQDFFANRVDSLAEALKGDTQ